MTLGIIIHISEIRKHSLEALIAIPQAGYLTSLARVPQWKHLVGLAWLMLQELLRKRQKILDMEGTGTLCYSRVWISGVNVY